jgi:hypothetical protein
MADGTLKAMEDPKKRGNDDPSQKTGGGKDGAANKDQVDGRNTDDPFRADPQQTLDRFRADGPFGQPKASGNKFGEKRDEKPSEPRTLQGEASLLLAQAPAVKPPIAGRPEIDARAKENLHAVQNFTDSDLSKFFALTAKFTLSVTRAASNRAYDKEINQGQNKFSGNRDIWTNLDNLSKFDPERTQRTVGGTSAYLTEPMQKCLLAGIALGDKDKNANMEVAIGAETVSVPMLDLELAQQAGIALNPASSRELNQRVYDNLSKIFTGEYNDATKKSLADKLGLSEAEVDYLHKRLESAEKAIATKPGERATNPAKAATTNNPADQGKPATGVRTYGSPTGEPAARDGTADGGATAKTKDSNPTPDATKTEPMKVLSEKDVQALSTAEIISRFKANDPVVTPMLHRVFDPMQEFKPQTADEWSRLRKVFETKENPAPGKEQRVADEYRMLHATVRASLQPGGAGGAEQFTGLSNIGQSEIEKALTRPRQPNSREEQIYKYVDRILGPHSEAILKASGDLKDLQLPSEVTTQLSRDDVSQTTEIAKWYRAAISGAGRSAAGEVKAPTQDLVDFFGAIRSSVKIDPKTPPKEKFEKFKQSLDAIKDEGALQGNLNKFLTYYEQKYPPAKYPQGPNTDSADPIEKHDAEVMQQILGEPVLSKDGVLSSSYQALMVKSNELNQRNPSGPGTELLAQNRQTNGGLSLPALGINLGNPFTWDNTKWALGGALQAGLWYTWNMGTYGGLARAATRVAQIGVGAAERQWNDGKPWGTSKVPLGKVGDRVAKFSNRLTYFPAGLVEDGVRKIVTSLSNTDFAKAKARGPEAEVGLLIEQVRKDGGGSGGGRLFMDKLANRYQSSWRSSMSWQARQLTEKILASKDIPGMGQKAPLERAKALMASDMLDKCLKGKVSTENEHGEHVKVQDWSTFDKYMDRREAQIKKELGDSRSADSVELQVIQTLRGIAKERRADHESSRNYTFLTFCEEDPATFEFETGAETKKAESGLQDFVQKIPRDKGEGSQMVEDWVFHKAMERLGTADRGHETDAAIFADYLNEALREIGSEMSSSSAPKHVQENIQNYLQSCTDKVRRMSTALYDQKRREFTQDRDGRETPKTREEKVDLYSSATKELFVRMGHPFDLNDAKRKVDGHIEKAKARSGDTHTAPDETRSREPAPSRADVESRPGDASRTDASAREQAGRLRQALSGLSSTKFGRYIGNLANAAMGRTGPGAPASEPASGDRSRGASGTTGGRAGRGDTSSRPASGGGDADHPTVRSRRGADAPTPPGDGGGTDAGAAKPKFIPKRGDVESPEKVAETIAALTREHGTMSRMDPDFSRFSTAVRRVQYARAAYIYANEHDGVNNESPENYRTAMLKAKGEVQAAIESAQPLEEVVLKGTSEGDARSAIDSVKPTNFRGEATEPKITPSEFSKNKGAPLDKYAKTGTSTARPAEVQPARQPEPLPEPQPKELELKDQAAASVAQPSTARETNTGGTSDSSREQTPPTTPAPVESRAEKIDNALASLKDARAEYKEIEVRLTEGMFNEAIDEYLERGGRLNFRNAEAARLGKEQLMDRIDQAHTDLIETLEAAVRAGKLDPKSAERLIRDSQARIDNLDRDFHDLRLAESLQLIETNSNGRINLRLNDRIEKEKATDQKVTGRRPRESRDEKEKTKGEAGAPTPPTARGTTEDAGDEDELDRKGAEGTQGPPTQARQGTAEPELDITDPTAVTDAGEEQRPAEATHQDKPTVTIRGEDTLINGDGRVTRIDKFLVKEMKRLEKEIKKAPETSDDPDVVTKEELRQELARVQEYHEAVRSQELEHAATRTEFLEKVRESAEAANRGEGLEEKVARNRGRGAVLARLAEKLVRAALAP